MWGLGYLSVSKTKLIIIIIIIIKLLLVISLCIDNSV